MSALDTTWDATWDGALDDQPADIRRAVRAARRWLRMSRFPARAADGAPEVVRAAARRDGVQIDVRPFKAALDEMAEDVAVCDALRRAADQVTHAPIAVVLFAIEKGGHYWCAPVGPLTGGPEAMPS